MMPGKKLLLQITSPRRASPTVTVPDANNSTGSNEDVSCITCRVAVSDKRNTEAMTILQDVMPLSQGSLRVTDNGSFNVYSKSQEYKFTPHGLVRKGGRRAVHPIDSQLSYKVHLSAAIPLASSIAPACWTQLDHLPL